MFEAHTYRKILSTFLVTKINHSQHSKNSCEGAEVGVDWSGRTKKMSARGTPVVAAISEIHFRLMIAALSRS